MAWDRSARRSSNAASTRCASLEAHFADAIDLPTLKRHQDRIRIALADVTKRLEAERHDHEGPRQHLATALRLLADCATSSLSWIAAFSSSVMRMRW
jgi:hypothetical protein